MEAGFCDQREVVVRLRESPRWVREPLIEWAGRRPPNERSFSYQVERGSGRLVVRRA